MPLACYLHDHMLRVFRFCAWVCVCLLALNAQAAPIGTPFFEKLSDISDADLTAYSVIQDRQGFIWIGTAAGVFRHDGYAFNQYKNKPDNPVNLQSPVYNFLEDKQGRIWICTNNGIAQLDPKTNSFNRPAFGSAANFSQVTRQVINDDKGGLWLATQKGLQYFNPDNGFIREYKHDSSRPDSIATENIKALTLDDKGGLWIATWPGGLDYLASGAASFVHYRLDTPAHPDALLNNVRALHFDNQHRLWIGSEAGIFLWQDGTDWSQRKHLANPSGADTFRVNNIYQDKNSTIWVASIGQGLLRWDSEKNQFISYKHRAENPYSLPGNSILSVLVDRSDTLWVGADSNGLSRANLGLQGFEQIFPRDLAMSTPEQSNQVFSLASDADNRLWLGSESGLTLIDVAKHTIIQRIQADVKQSGSLSNNVIYSLYKAQNGPLWIGTAAGLNRLDKAGGPFRVVHFDNPGSDFVSHIAPGRDGILWLATGGGLIRYDPGSGAIHRFSHDPADPHSRSINSTYVSFEDSAGRVWAAGANNGGGLDVLDQATGKFSLYLHDPANPASLSDDHVFCLFEDKPGVLWVGTDKGLNRVVYKPDGSVEFRAYPKSNFVSDRISSIESDKAGHLWINTSAGLFKFDPATGNVTDFSLRKHFADTIDQSSVRDNQGMLYFGSGKGIMAVDPEVAGIEFFAPRVAITDISILNHSLREDIHPKGVALAGTIREPKALTLSYLNNIFSLEFSALHYANPALNRYAYRMDGFDKDWVYVDAQHRNATYTNLDPGSYVFHVKASNNAGDWSEISLPVTITPPFWATWWFRMLLAAGITVLAVLIYRWRIRQFNLNEIRLENLVAERSIEAISLRDEAISSNLAKSEFIANMSHEIRTPMNSILGMTHLALNTEVSGKSRNYLEKIHLSGLHLLGIIEEILDFSKISANKLKLEEVDLDLKEVLDGAKILFEQRIREKGLTLVVDIDPALPRSLRGDPLRLGQVLINYVSNAVKFTDKGNIVVRVRRMDENDDSVLVRFEVQDEGVGIADEAKSRLFLAFQQADASTTRIYGGTGLGLSICRQLSELMNDGEVGVVSSPGQGSTFWLGVRLKKGGLHQKNIEDADAAASPQFKGARILVAEDHPFNQEVITDILANVGAVVCIAQNGKEALELLDEQYFDCVLMDIQMPVMDGFEAVRLIRVNPALAGMPVIAMTASASTEDQKIYLAAGMNDFIGKPFDPNVFYSTIAKWLLVRKQAVLDMPTAVPVSIAEVIDLSVLAKWIGEDRLKLRGFAIRFLESARLDMTKIDAALGREDFAALATLAHRVSSPARMVGAIGFADLCLALEQHGKIEGEVKQVQQIISQLHTMLDQIAERIDQELA